MYNKWLEAGGHLALSQSTHEKINASHYPGTRQLCIDCDAPTGRCEEDSLFGDDGEHGPVCEACWLYLNPEKLD